MDNLTHVRYNLYFIPFRDIELNFQIASVFQVYVIPPKEIFC
jgi:hypothetical protein